VCNAVTMVWWWWRGRAARSEATGTVRTLLRWRYGNAGSDNIVATRRLGFRIMPIACVTFLTHTYTFYQQLHSDLFISYQRSAQPTETGKVCNAVTMVWWWWRGWAARSEATGTVRTLLRWRYGNAGSDNIVATRRLGFRIMPIACVTFLSHTDTFYQQLHSDLFILTRGRPSRPKRERRVMALQRSGGGGGGGQPGAKRRACCVRWWLKARAIETFRHRADM